MHGPLNVNKKKNTFLSRRITLAKLNVCFVLQLGKAFLARRKLIKKTHLSSYVQIVFFCFHTLNILKQNIGAPFFLAEEDTVGTRLRVPVFAK